MSQERKGCPLCQLIHTELRFQRITETLTYNYYCPRCHNFITSHEFLLFGGGEGFDDKRHLVSGLARELSERKEEPPKVFTTTISTLLTHPLIPADEDIDAKCEKILVFLKRKSSSLGKSIRLYDELEYAIAYARDAEEFAALIKSLVGNDLAKITLRDSYQNWMFHNLALTHKGWKRAKELSSAPAPIQTPPPTPPPSPPTSPMPSDDSDEVPKPSAVIMALYEGLQLHPTVQKVSGRLFKDGHYAPAIFEAYKAINNAVKKKAGAVDASNDHTLMAVVFSEENPILRLNSLSDDSEISEQLGFKFLFMGATTGIRNPKAHQNIEQKDPIKTLHYLSFASLLMAMVDVATVQSPATAPSEEKD